MLWLEALGVPWGIYPLNESMSGRVQFPNRLSVAVLGCRSTIGVKQGCPLSPTLFALYIDEVSHYLERSESLEGCIEGIAIRILLYVDDIVLMSDSLDLPQRRLNALKSLCMD